MATLYHQVWINARPAKLYEVISTEKGAGCWWDEPHATEPDSGLVWELRPGSEHGVLRIKVLKRIQGKRVERECISIHLKTVLLPPGRVHISFLKSLKEIMWRFWIFSAPAGMKTANISDSATIIGAWHCKSLNDGVNHSHCAVKKVFRQGV